MKKAVIAGVAVILLCISQAGCGGKAAVSDDADQAANAEQAEDENVSASTDGDDAQDSEEGGFSFADLSEYSFYFSSGAGAWGTVLNINADGSFSGDYQDSDMGDTGEGYPNGTVYVCSFNGRFAELTQVNEYTYSMRLEELKYDHVAGPEKIEDEVKYVYSEAYGMDGGDEFLIYLPGAPVSELPEAFISWVNYSIADASELPFCGLYNVAEQLGFSGYPKEGFGEESSVPQDSDAQYTDAYDDYSYTKYAGAYTQRDGGGFCQINMYSSREGAEIGNIEMTCDEIIPFQGTIYDYGTPDEYTVESEVGYWYLEFYYEDSTPCFKLKAEPPQAAASDEWIIWGDFYMTEHYES